MEIRVALPSILMASAYRESLFPSFCARSVWLHLLYFHLSLSWASAAFSALIYAARALFFCGGSASVFHQMEKAEN
jgi:hypothetical protein